MSAPKLFVAAAMFSLLLTGVAARPAGAGDDHGPGKQAPRDPGIAKIVKKTDELLIRAHGAAKAGGEKKAEFRTAWVKQRAAREAMRHERLALSARLSLEARAVARKVIEANGQKLGPDDTKDDPAEIKAAEGASDADAEAAVKAEDPKTPSADEILASEPKPDEHRGENQKK